MSSPGRSKAACPQAASHPKVSIGMPVYNGAKYIRQALDSLLAQTFADFELIISDNASADDTEAICRDYAARDTRVRYVRQARNLGAWANFQYVLDQSQGEYFMWAAHDDMWDRECLDRWVCVLEGNEGISLVFSNYEVLCRETGEKRRVHVQCSVSSNRTNRLLTCMLNPTPSLVYGMFRRQSLADVKLKAYDYLDMYLVYYMALQGVVFVCSEFLYCAGIESKARRPYSLTGKVIRPWAFARETMRLIHRQVSLVYRPLVCLMLWRQVLLFWHCHRLAREGDD